MAEAYTIIVWEERREVSKRASVAAGPWALAAVLPWLPVSARGVRSRAFKMRTVPWREVAADAQVAARGASASGLWRMRLHKWRLEQNREVLGGHDDGVVGPEERAVEVARTQGVR